MKKNIIVLALSLALAGCSVTSPPQGASDAQVKAAAKKYANVISEQDYITVKRLRERTLAKRAITDEDFGLVITLLQRPSTEKSSFLFLNVAAAISSVAKFSDDQHAQLVKTARPLLQRPEGLTQRSALAILGQLKDNDSVPEALPLLKSKDEMVVASTKKFLTAVGYKEAN